MRAPSEAHINQSVRIRHEQRPATSSELNSTCREATNCVKLEGWMYQATTQVKVLSPEIIVIVEVDAVHLCGRQYCLSVKASEKQLYRGLSPLHDTRWKIGELGRTSEFFDREVH
jgi:hypothetical protein